MRRPVFFPLLAMLVGCLLGSPGRAAELTATETRWLQAAGPVIAHARKLGLPLDIIVQPQPTAGLAPLALAFVNGRCKLVLSMRGNPEAQATLDRIPPPLLNAAVELMAAHELGHCRRYLDGAWYHVPAGFVSSLPESLEVGDRVGYADMQATRREEAYGDLVGLAWTHLHHPQLYAAVHAWLVTLRSEDLIPGSHHDTLAWIHLAKDGAPLAQAGFFAGPAVFWASGLGLAD